MHYRLLAIISGMFFVATALTVPAAETWIVQDGQPKAEIVIAPAPKRLVKLAAEELQAYVKKMTGAELPVVTNASADAAPVKLYVGQSAATDAMGITDAGLKNDGAFRIKSGPDYLVLLGHDFDFEPPVPAICAKSTGGLERAQAEWDKMTADRTDSAWGNPLAGLHRSFNAESGTWFMDQSGTLNAVYEFLQMQGVRWYMPGDLGEVVPQQTSLAFPSVDIEVTPDFPVRRFFGPAYLVMSRDDLLWMRRLGVNHGYPVLGLGPHVHGLRNMHGRKEMQSAHPEYYALVGGVRWTNEAGHVCFSSDGLVREAANYARAMYDLLDEPVVDFWPNDGIRLCECKKCSGKSAAELVFGFVDRVARDVYKTHPDRMVTCGAYSAYRLPPTNITKFSPNVGISIAFSRTGLDQPETWGRGLGISYDDLIFGWRNKTESGWIMGNSNHRSLPLMPRSIAADLRARKGKSIGDWNEVGHRARAGETSGGRAIGRQTWALGIHHLNVYVNAHLLWDADQDLEELLDDYYKKFYGPVADQVRAAFEFAEAKYPRGAGSPALSLDDHIKLIEMLHAARDQAGDTIYGRRIAYVLEEEKPLDDLLKARQDAQSMEELRAQAPLIIARDPSVSDKPAPVYSLVDLKTGEKPPIETIFQVEWDQGALVFDIRCQDPDMENLFVTRDIWGGDSVAILIETPFHSYYQIEINPDGVIYDADCQLGFKSVIATKWDAQAKIETERGKDFWRLKVKFPIMDEAAGVLDPLHNIVGEKPTAAAPWFVQIGRVRIRNFEKSAYGFTATGGTYHNRSKFGRLAVE
ncbi:MAG: DUF4838 domain-containing protein [Lentisphaerae bacterium]|nr:DUF4838 domain-containing protein [Lentisphaerota bacterium]